MKRYLIITILSFFINNALQSQNIDSLLNIYNTGTKSESIESANKLYRILYNKQFCDSLIVFKRGTNKEVIESSLFPQLADYLIYINQYEKAKNLAIRGIEAAEQENNNKMVGLSCSVLCIVYQMSGDFDIALGYAKRCYYIDQLSGNPQDMSSSLNNLAGICLSLHHNKEAKEYINKAIQIERPLNREAKLAIRLGMASEIYMALGELDKALQFCKEAYDLDIKTGNTPKAAIRMCQIAAVYQAKKDYSNAKKYYQEAVEPLINSNNFRSLSICYNSLGKLSMQEGDLSEAEKWINKAISASKQSGYIMQLQKAYTMLAEVLKKSRPETAIKYYELSASIRDSLFTVESERQLNKFNVQFQTREKEYEIERQQAQIEKQHIKQYMLIIILVSLAIIAVSLIVIVRIQRRRYQELKETNEIKSKFFSIISHDLKNPVIAQKNILVSICNNYKNISLDMLYSQCIELMHSSESLLELLYNLLNWSRLETGRMAVAPIRFDLNEICKDIESIVKAQLINKNLTLLFNMPAETIVYADCNMITTVLHNIIGNSIKFSEKGQTIELRATINKDICEVSIHDHGIGMSAETISTLFKIKDKHLSIGTIGEHGSGLGLVICKEMVELNGGQINITSKEGEGTTVKFTIKSA